MFGVRLQECGRSSAAASPPPADDPCVRTGGESAQEEKQPSEVTAHMEAQLISCQLLNIRVTIIMGLHGEARTLWLIGSRQSGRRCVNCRLVETRQTT